jgi:hypothetical protein
MISIGATAAGSSTSEVDGTAFSKWSEGLQDRFSQEILESDGLPRLLEEQTNEANAKIQETYKKKFLNFENADRSLEGIVNETIDSTLAFVTGIQASVNTFFGGGDTFGGSNKDLVNKAALYRYIDNDINEKRIVKDSKLNTPPNGTAMYFNDYYQAILDTQESDRLNQIIDSKDISKLINENYNIYLLNAFSGQSNIIKVRTQDTELVINEREGVVRGERNLDSSTVTSLLINQQRYQEFDDTFISQGKSAYKTYINNLNNTRYKITQTPSSEIGFIPLSFDVVLDGISGIKIYNKLNINNEFLPSNYPNSLNFIITKVNHSIANNSWDTSLSTISIPKTEPYKFNTSPTTSTQSNVNVEGSSIKGPQPDNGSPFLILDGRNGRNIITLDNLLLELDPKARPSFRKFFNILKDRYSGYKAIVNSVRRTWEESYNLKFTPNTNSFNPSNAAPGFSLHNYGLAIDINIETPASTTKRTLLKRNKTPWIEEGLDKVAIEADLRWGGNFTNYEDCVHFDFYYNLNTAYNQILTQSQNLDSTIKPPFTPFSNGLQKCQKIDKLIKEGKIKLV